MSEDARAQQARELHEKAKTARQHANRYKQQRDALVVQLRNDDPARWTFAALGRAVGCSTELIQHIVRNS